MSAAYGAAVEPQEIFDAVLALLSATSYTTRFAHDLEDDFPHVPFPADPEQFQEAVRIGARLRALQSFAEAPAGEFRQARLVGQASGPELDVPTPRRAFTGDDEAGYGALRADQSLRLSGVSERAWNFSVSGYQVFYRWLRARNGQTITADLQREILDTIARIDESLHLFDLADAVLAQAVEASLTCAQLGLPADDRAVQVGAEDNSESDRSFRRWPCDKTDTADPDPDDIRARLNAVLRELREAECMPWTPAQVRSWKHVFHNMANWLPADERDEIRQDFVEEITRLQGV